MLVFQLVETRAGLGRVDAGSAPTCVCVGAVRGPKGEAHRPDDVSSEEWEGLFEWVTWKLALLRAQPGAHAYHSLEVSPHHKPPAGTSAREFESAASSGGVPRFMLVRNPYSRLLSAYLDKVMLQNVTGM